MFEDIEDTNKYYTKYNRDIKSIRGAGVITKRGPPNTNKTVGTVREILDEDIQATPPLYPVTWQFDAEQTSGYLNEYDYLDYVPDINKYYYTAQQIDDIDVRKNKKTKTNEIIKNNNEIIKLPPQLVTSKPEFSPNDSEFEIPRKFKENNIKNKKTDNKNTKKSEEEKEFDESDFGIGQNDINRKWYDGRYVYTFSPSTLKTIYPWINYTPVASYGSKKDQLNFLQDSGITKFSQDQLARTTNFDDTENFTNTETESKFNIHNINMLYLALICLLLIIYFIRNK